MSTRIAVSQRAAARRVPPLGGFNLTFLAIEVRRLLRNRRTTIFTLILPVVFYLLFRNGRRGGQPVDGTSLNAYVMVSMGVYGAMIASTAGGAMVAVERALGWSRQLRLTPLRPFAYMAIKVLSAMVLSLMSVTAVFAVGALTGVRMPAMDWILCGVLAWAGSLVFATFGLFMGYLFPSENVMQIIGPVLALSAFFGGIFIPLNKMGPASSTFQAIAPFTPTYGVGEIARSPLIGSGPTVRSVVNIMLWTAAFVIGAATLFRRDTQRV